MRSMDNRSYRIRSRLVAFGVGLVALSAVSTTMAAGNGKPDRIAPSVSIAQPTEGASLAGTISVSGSATDNVKVAAVDVSIDGGTYRRASGTTKWTIALDTTTSGDGVHSIAARATDPAGNKSVTSVSVAFANHPVDSHPPTVAITLPSSGATVTGAMSVTGTASDDVGVARVEIRVDSGSFRVADGVADWAYLLDSTSYADGNHTVAARATDASGNLSTTTEVINVQNAVAPPLAPAVTAPVLAPGTIGGFAFEDPNRDGVYQTDEQPLGGEHLFLYSATGTYLRNTYSDAYGWYAFTGLADGSYRVEFDPASWWGLRDDWVPDTTGSTSPGIDVVLSGAHRSDFGWRPIRRSTQAGAPISAYVGPSGVRVESYDDVVPARDIYDRLLQGALVGPEAKDVTIRFDLTKTGTTSTMAVQTNGVYTDYSATSNVTYVSWLDGDGELFHEYGHAWSLYYAHLVQQDPSLTAYVKARGLQGDARLGTSYAWEPREMIAEDYRQLFGTASARAVAQMNREIPPAKDVPGLAAFLSTTFTQPPSH